MAKFLKSRKHKINQVFAVEEKPFSDVPKWKICICMKTNFHYKTARSGIITRRYAAICLAWENFCLG